MELDGIQSVIIPRGSSYVNKKDCTKFYYLVLNPRLVPLNVFLLLKYYKPFCFFVNAFMVEIEKIMINFNALHYTLLYLFSFLSDISNSSWLVWTQFEKFVIG